MTQLENLKIVPEQVKKTFFTAIWLTVAGLAINILGINDIGLGWMSLSRIVILFVSFLFIRCGWKNYPSNDNVAKFYFGVTRIIGAILAMLSLQTPYEWFLGNKVFATPLWNIFWLAIFVITFVIGKFYKVFKETIYDVYHDPQVQNSVAKGIVIFISFIREWWVNASLIKKIVVIGITILLIKFFI